MGESIDLVIHSGKDLGSDRPQGITQACVLPRAIPNDIFFCTKKTKEKLLNGEFTEFIVGSSSPRRIAQSKYLKEFIPGLSKSEIINKNLRGNIDTRLKKLIDGEHDGIILAAAGIQRVTYLQEGQRALKELSKDLEFSLLPLSFHTPAASQGALIVECLEQNKSVLRILKELNDPITHDEIISEKKIFNENGGSCYLPLGIYRKNHTVMISGKTLEKVEKRDSFSLNTHLKKINGKIFVGLKRKISDDILNDQLIEKNKLNHLSGDSENSYLASSNSIEQFKKYNHQGLIFGAGAHSMMTLARENYWCHGIANLEGEKSIIALKDSTSFNYFHDFKKPWKSFTHQDSKSLFDEVISSYERKILETDDNFKKSLKECNIFYWTSYFQYETYLKNYDFLESNDIVHCTGYGKTHEEFKQRNIPHHPISSYRELLNYE